MSEPRPVAPTGFTTVGQYRPIAMVAMAMWAFVVAGCSSEPYDYVAVSGSVTYDDGSPIPAEEIRLMFLPQVEPVDKRTYPLKGRAIVDANGSFAGVTSHKHNDGVVPGKHKVLVIALDGTDLSGAVPEIYTREATTPLLVDTSDAPWKLQVRKPDPAEAAKGASQSPESNEGEDP